MKVERKKERKKKERKIGRYKEVVSTIVFS